MAGSGGVFPLESLTRKHGIKIATEGFVPIEKCMLAIGKVVGHENIKSASRMNGSVVAFLSQTDLVNKIVEHGIILNDSLVAVTPLVTPARKIIISNVPPFLKNALIVNELSRHGQIVSAPKRIPLGCKSPLLQHVVSFRRQLFMVLNKASEELNIVLKFKVDGCDYVIFATSETMKCFNCGADGHLIKNCPKAKDREEREGGEVSEKVAVNLKSTEPSKVDVETESGGMERGNVNAENDGEVAGTSVGVEVSRTKGKTGEQEIKNTSSDGNEKQIESGTVNDTNSTREAETGEVREDNQGAGENKTESIEENASEKVSEMSNMAMEMSENINDNDGFKTPTKKKKKKFLKRKNIEVVETREKEQPPKKEGQKPWSVLAASTIHESNSESEREEEEEEEEVVLTDSSQCSESILLKSGYGEQDIREFLLLTKGRRKIDVEDFFPDLSLFVNSAAYLVKKSSGSNFTDQERWCLKNCLIRVRSKLNQKQKC